MGSSNPSPTFAANNYHEDTLVTWVNIPTDIDSDVYAVREYQPLEFEDDEITAVIPNMAQLMAEHDDDLKARRGSTAAELCEFLPDDCLLDDSDEVE